MELSMERRVRGVVYFCNFRIRALRYIHRWTSDTSDTRYRQFHRSEYRRCQAVLLQQFTRWHLVHSAVNFLRDRNSCDKT